MTTLTHHKTLARRLTGSTTLTYQQSLLRVRAAASRNELPSRLDPSGMTATYHRLRTIHRLEQPPTHRGVGSAASTLPLSADLPDAIAPIRELLTGFAGDTAPGDALELSLNRFAHLEPGRERAAMTAAAIRICDLVDTVHGAGNPYTDTTDVYMFTKNWGPYGDALAALVEDYDDDDLRELGKIRTSGEPDDERRGGHLELGFLLSTAIAVVRPHRLNWTMASPDRAEAALPTPEGCLPLIATASRRGRAGRRLSYECAVRTVDCSDKFAVPVDFDSGRTLTEVVSFADSIASQLLTEGLRDRVDHATGRKLWPQPAA